MKIAAMVFDLISPAWCVACGRPVSRVNRHICAECLDKIDFVHDGCPVCSGMLVDGECGICNSRQIYFDRNIIVMEYEGTAKAIITGYKFAARRRMAALVAELCFDRVSELLPETDYVTAVPSSAKKKWKRGFNQSEEIARLIARKSGRPYVPLLRELGHSEKQKTLGLSNRFLNVLGRYSLSSKGKSRKTGSVLIVDDVFTTGATINECARILKDSGFDPVFSLAAARVAIKRLEK